MRIRTIDNRTRKVYLHEETIREYGLSEVSYITLRIGALAKKVQLIGRITGERDIVGLSKDISNEVNLPEGLSYQMVVRDGELLIGPVLGLMVSHKEEYLTERRLQHYLNLVTRYNEVQGLVIAFTLEGVMDDDKKVIGYAYDPKKKSWVRGVYVFPAAVYVRRASVNMSLHDRLTKLVGNNFYNSYAFNKWELWDWLSKSPAIRPHLPETVLARDSGDVERLLNKFGKVYIKPYRGFQGLGIYQVEKSDRGYELRTRVEGENREQVFKTWSKLYQQLSADVDLMKYIAQQNINLLKVDDRIADMRVIAQKGRRGQWEIHGAVSRFGGKESVVSNISSGGHAENTGETLLKLYGKDAEMEAYCKWTEIQALALKTSEKLETAGFHYGNLGLDIALDQNGQLWIIEVNNVYPDHTIALDAANPMLYHATMGTPLLYSKWLAGFGDK